MRKIVFTIITLFGFIFIASAQEDQDKTQRQPTVVTQSQVEKDERMAQEERKKHEEDKKTVKEEKQKKDARPATASSPDNRPAKKTSTHPGKQ